jgi:DNA polymerase bacteriophage-type
MPTLFIDFETRSTVDLKKAGLHNYATHPSTDIYGMCYTIEGEGQTVSGTVWREDPYCPSYISDMVRDKSITVVAHNASFELAIWNNVCKRYGWPTLNTSPVRCTAAMAYAAALPGSLDGCSKALGLTVEKDMVGHRLMMKMCKPLKTKDGSIKWFDAPENIDRLMQYCSTDVEVERQIYHKLMKLSDYEQKVWELDQKINNRGIYVDLRTIDKALQIVGDEQKRLGDSMRVITNGAVGSCSQAKALTDWLRYSGIEISGVAKADVKSALEGSLPPGVREALETRQEAAKSSTAKLVAMKEAASSDSRVRGILQYHGAATGRWAGRKIQTQNFPRGFLKPKHIDHALDLINRGETELLSMLYGTPLSVISSCLRSLITAPTGGELIAADFNAIECRVLAWLAGEQSVLDIFNGHGLIYEHAAAGIYNVPMEKVTSDQRQIGKVAILALGYQGGVGAFQTMAKAYGVEVSDSKAEDIKAAWRKANPNIVRYWYELQAAAIEAVYDNSRAYKAGPQGREVAFRKSGDFLLCRLPSGRLLTYPFPELVVGNFGREVLQYKGVDSFTKKWQNIQTYGGKLCENITQAVARDILADALIRLDANGFKVVNHIHDEIVVEIEETAPDDTLQIIESLMGQTPAWAKDLPMVAKGWRAKRYRK